MSFNSKRSMNGTKKLHDEEGRFQAVKREAETSPGEPSKKKRYALGDLTNAVQGNVSFDIKKNLLSEDRNKASANKKNKKRNFVLMGLLSKNNAKEQLEDTLKSSQESFFSSKSDITVDQEDERGTENCQEENLVDSPVLPPGVVDFDKETINEQYSEPNFAMDIFKYYKEREVIFKLDDYLLRQTEISKGMRSILVDWMVEVQESFELNHETLYLGVKLVDHYLSKHVVTKSTLQLLGATAIFLACKFDERSPPLIDDFLYICDDAYSRKELLAMEISILKTMDFDLGIPLSYRFLRRYARCAKLPMDTLTLARFILELSLMEYDLIQISDSKLAAASLLLALKMKGVGEWTPTLQYYTDYEETHLLELMYKLNSFISAPHQKSLSTVRTKYSHKVFFEVAKILPLKPKVT